MNVLQYAAITELNFFKTQVNDFGYESFTTFYSDLTIGEVVSGTAGVKDTIKRCVNSWKSDYKYFTEFIMALNYKTWEMDYHISHKTQLPAKINPTELLELYSEEYYKYKDFFYDFYKDNHEALDYFFEVTD